MNSVNQVLSKISKGEYSPVYLLIGKERFFHDQIIKLLTTELFSDPSSRSLNRIIIDSAEKGLPDIVGASQSYPMLSKYKLVIVKEFNKVKNSEIETFYHYLANPQKATILLLMADELPQINLFKKTREKANVVDCKPIPEYKVQQWIRERLQQKKRAITAEAISLLADYTGNNLLGVDLELKKLIEYKNDDSEINHNDLIAASGMSKDYNVFALQKALIERNKSQSLKIAKNLIESGENVNLVISIIFSFFKKTLVFEGLNSISKGSKTYSTSFSDYQLRELEKTAKNFSRKKIEEILTLLHNLDSYAKRSLSSDWAIIQSLCYNICRA